MHGSEARDPRISYCAPIVKRTSFTSSSGCARRASSTGTSPHSAARCRAVSFACSSIEEGFAYRCPPPVLHWPVSLPPLCAAADPSPIIKCPDDTGPTLVCALTLSRGSATRAATTAARPLLAAKCSGVQRICNGVRESGLQLRTSILPRLPRRSRHLPRSRAGSARRGVDARYPHNPLPRRSEGASRVSAQ